MDSRNLKIRNNKFNNLKLNLKNCIFDYLPFVHNIQTTMITCKSFKSSILKRLEIQTIKENFTHIMREISFSEKILLYLKDKYFKKLYTENIKATKILDEILKYMLFKKYKHQKALILQRCHSSKKSFNPFSIGPIKLMKPNLSQLKNKKVCLIDSKDIYFDLFCEYLSKNNFIVHLEINTNDIFKNEKKILNSHLNSFDEYEESLDSFEIPDKFFNQLQENNEEENESIDNKIQDYKYDGEKNKLDNINPNLKKICEILKNKKYLKTLKFINNFNEHQLPNDVDIFFGSVMNVLSLEHLEFKNNKLGRNVTDIFYFKNHFSKNFSIIKLNLSENKICESQMDLKNLYDALLLNNSLKELDLSFNRIGLNETDLFYIKLLLKNNKTLEKLDLSGNQIGENSDNDIIFISKGIKKNTNLKILKMNNNLIGNNAFAIYHLIKGLNKNKTLKELDISDNDIRNSFTESLCKENINTEKINIYLEKLVLDSNNIGLEVLSQILIKNTTLNYLSLGDADFSENESNYKSLCGIIKSNKCIKHLNLNSNGLGINNNIINTLSEALIENNTLEFIDISNNDFGEDESQEDFKWDFLKNILESNKTLKCIEFNDKYEIFQRNYDFTLPLLKGLRSNETIQKINLSNMTIGDNKECYSVLCDIIENHKSLKILDLSSNKLFKNQIYIKGFCEALKKSKNLEKLTLSNNKIGDSESDMYYLCDAISENSSLKELDFGTGNHILRHEADKKFLLQSLKENSNLKKLNCVIKKENFDKNFVNEIRALNVDKIIKFKTKKKI